MVMAQNPLTGLGIKPLDRALMEIPIGSHSTISSTFAKGGFIALGVLGTIFAALIGGVVRAPGAALVPARAAGRARRPLRADPAQSRRAGHVAVVDHGGLRRARP